MNDYPMVSVITFVYVNAVNGREELFKECLESIEMQKYPNYEHIIIDDGSDIDLKPLVDNFPHTKYVKKEGSGILSSTKTFNLGHEIAKGEYCIYLPSDDLHFNDSIVGMVEAMEKVPEAQMAIGKAVYEYSDGRVTSWSPNAKNIENNMNLGNYVNGCAVMWRKRDLLLNLLPPYYTGFCSDYDIWCTLIKLGKVIYPDVNVVKYRQADDSTRNKTRSRFITSPRVQDSKYFQYSKEARIEFVKDRSMLSVEEMRRDNNIEQSLEINLDNVEVNEGLISLFEKRNWDKLDIALKKESNYLSNSEILKSNIFEEKQVVLVSSLNLPSIVLMHKYKKEFFYILKYDYLINDWLYEFLPMPFINKVLDFDNKLNEELMNYLGLETIKGK